MNRITYCEKNSLKDSDKVNTGKERKLISVFHLGWFKRLDINDNS